MEDEIFIIEKLDHFGRGMVKYNDKIIFINNAMIGDTVKIKVISEKKNYVEAEVSSFINKSSNRINDFCEYLDCGGCNINFFNYNDQLKFKENKIKDLVRKYLKEDIKINNIIYSENSNYRNKITLHVSNKKVGLYKNKSNELIEIKECKLVNNEINKIIIRLKEFINKVDCELNEIVIKITNLNEKMIVFKGKVNKEDVLKEFNDIDSIFINELCLKNEYIKEKLGDYEFIQSKDSFFQVNGFNTENLYDEVKRLIGSKKYNKALDLYCGTGTIGIYVSKLINEIIGIEVVSDAIKSANINKKINNVNNISFINGKVEDHIDKFNDIDLIIMDPPRSGLDKKTKNVVLDINPEKIIYVSCDPMTLMRDLNELKEKYLIKEITPVDMFPNTYHVESVVLLERR